MANKVLILVGNWLVQFLELGTMKSFAVLLVHMVRDLESTTGRVGMFVGIYHAVTLMSGVIVKVLLHRYSPRSLAMIGGLIGSVGLMACSQVNKDIYFAISLIFSGFGLSLTLIPTMLSLVFAFKGAYMLPYSVASMGAGMGMMILPLLTQKLLDAYDWRGALLILGAINLHLVVCGTWLDRSSSEKESPPSNYDPQESSLNHDESYKLASSSEDPRDPDNAETVQQSVSHRDSSASRFFRRSLTLVRAACQGAGLYIFSEHPLIVYAFLAACLHGVSYVGWTVFVISNAEGKGYAEDVAVLLAIAGGVGNIAGRLMPGLFNFLNKDLFPSRTLFIIFGFIGALPLCLNRIATLFSTLCVFAAINGFALGAKTVVKNTNAIDVVPQSLSSTVFPFVLIFTGLGEVAGGWVTGRIFDITGSMDTAFLFLGCVDIFCVIVLFLSLLHEKVVHLRSSS